MTADSAIPNGRCAADSPALPEAGAPRVLVRGVANAGKLAVNWDKLLNDPDRPLVVVDSSPTGLSESLDYLL